MSLNKLFNLTSKPYSQSEREAKVKRQMLSVINKLKLEKPDLQEEDLINYCNQKKKEKSMFDFDNEIFRRPKLD